MSVGVNMKAGWQLFDGWAICYTLQVEVVESLAEGLDQMEAEMDHEDQRSEHSDQEQDNPPPDHDDGKHITSVIVTKLKSAHNSCSH